MPCRMGLLTFLSTRERYGGPGCKPELWMVIPWSKLVHVGSGLSQEVLGLKETMRVPKGGSADNSMFED